jgi:hypothetical protein
MYEQQLVFTIIFVSICIIFIIYETFFMNMKEQHFIDSMGVGDKTHEQIMGGICRGRCSHKVCRDYHRRLHDFHMCRKCHAQNKCYSKPKGSCVPCSKWELKKHCESMDSYGCQNPHGFQHPDVPPINPANTHCQPCWENQNDITIG